MDQKRLMLGTAIVLATSMYLTACGSGGGSGAPKLTPEQQTGATALCEKGLSCNELSSSQMDQCVNQAAGALQIFPDPDSFSACVDGLTCEQLNDSASMKKCVDFDYSSFVCSGSDSLYGCSNSGKCTTISCTDVCTLLGGTFDHCGASNSTDKAKNICWCRK